VGGQLEAGYQMPLGATWFWEPLGLLSYVNSSVGNIAIPGGAVQLGNVDSFRGSLGARVGVNSDFQYFRTKLAITARVWDEWRGDTDSAIVLAGAPTFTNNDGLKGAFGEVQGEANLFANHSGVSAFVNGGVKFKDHYSDTNVTLGARYQW
jgi:outer membrane autotransporter protein